MEKSPTGQPVYWRQPYTRLRRLAYARQQRAARTCTWCEHTAWYRTYTSHGRTLAACRTHKDQLPRAGADA